MSARLRDIADRLGVSVTTVSRVLNGRSSGGRISHQCAQRVRQMAEEMAYRPNAAARAMVSQRTRTVGVLTVNSPRRPFTCPQTYFTILGINMALEAAGYLVALIRLDDVTSCQSGARVFREHCVDGLIIANIVPDEVARVAEAQCPACVWVDGNTWRDALCVRRDEVAAGRMAAEMLIAGGYRELVFAGPVLATADHFSHEHRYAGARLAADAAGVGISAVSADAIESLVDRDIGIVAGDVNWCRRIQGQAMLKRRVPGVDFGLASCEGTPDMAAVWPDLSRVEFDRLAMGRVAADMALKIIEDEQPLPSVLLPSELTPGRTAGQRPH